MSSTLSSRRNIMMTFLENVACSEGGDNTDRALLHVYNLPLSTVIAPVNTSSNNLSASSAKRTMLVCLSVTPVSTALVTSPSGVETAKMTYPLWEGAAHTA